ncbi:DUF6233 domain-containing protein [Streptomyces olivaceus]
MATARVVALLRRGQLQQLADEQPPDWPPTATVSHRGSAPRWLTVVQARAAVPEQRHPRPRPATRRTPAPRPWPPPGHRLHENIDAVHTGDCWTVAGSDRCRPVSRDQVVEAMRHQVSACSFWRPETALGLLG